MNSSITITGINVTDSSIFTTATGSSVYTDSSVINDSNVIAIGINIANVIDNNSNTVDISVTNDSTSHTGTKSSTTDMIISIITDNMDNSVLQPK